MNNDIINAYIGMSYDESVTHQIKHWAVGVPTHNPIANECCPDFSCCTPSLLMTVAARQRFLEAHLSGDDKTRSSMLLMCLGELLADINANVYIIEENPDEVTH